MFPCTLEAQKIKHFKFESEKKFKLVADLQKGVVLKFLSWLRFIVFDGDIQVLKKVINDFYKANKDEKNKPEWVSEMISRNELFVKPFDIQNETSVWKWIQVNVSAAQSFYPTTLEEDLEIVKSQEFTYNQRNCISLRIGEKKILKYFEDVSKKLVSLSKLSRQEAMKVA